MVCRVLFAVLLVANAMSAMAQMPLADELRWHPVDSVGINLTDTIAADNPESAVPSVQEVADPISEPEDPNRNWWHLLKEGKLKMDDPTVEWPKFLGFCAKVYNWGDRVFSSTDPDYVVGTGKKWRTRLINDNWTDSYYIRFHNDFKSLMSGNLHVLAGVSLQYMAVSYTYSVDISHLVTGGMINYKKQEFGFNCARFSIDAYYYSNDGGTFIRTFGNYKKDGRRHVKIPFTGVSMSTFGFDGYYFINGYKYSQGAAYNFSRIQKKSHGCFIAGFSYCQQDISLDFTKLPEELLPYADFDKMKFRLHYNDYNFLLGYGYNCVMGKHWLYNITLIPGIGFNHCYEDSEMGSAKLFSLGGRLMTSFTYNSGNLFAGLQGHIRSCWYNSNSTSLFNAVETITLSAGFRF